jgi:hypothetical protein
LVPEVLHAIGMIEHAVDGIGNLFRCEKIDEQPILAVLDDFHNRCGSRTDNGASGRHGLHHRPAQDERISQVDVNGRYLKQGNQSPVRQPREKVKARKIQTIADLSQHDLPPGAAVGGSAAIAYGVPTDNDRVESRPSPLDARKCPHERMEATIRLEVPIYKGEHLIGLGQGQVQGCSVLING